MLVARLPGARSALSALQTLRFDWKHRGRRPVVVVHQMARVGSVSVLRAIRRAAPATNLFHTHYLNPASIRHFEAQADRNFAANGDWGLHRELLAARWLTARLRRRGNGVGRWRVVSLVRDPVARTVSAFFRHFEYVFPLLGTQVRDDPARVGQLLELFRNQSEFEHDFALNWFEREVQDVFGIDVYADPFPHGTGYTRFSAETCDLLLLRLEDLDRTGADVLQDFLGLPHVRLASENSAEREPYAASYRQFLAQWRPTAEYLDRMYESRLARHFYTADERALFRARWQHTGLL